MCANLAISDIEAELEKVAFVVFKDERFPLYTE